MMIRVHGRISSSFNNLPHVLPLVPQGEGRRATEKN